MGVQEEIAEVLRRSGVLAVRAHPRLARTAQRYAARGLLRQVLPGVYCRAEDVGLVETTARAVAARAPDAVITGPAAARLSFLPTVPVTTFTVSRRHGLRGAEVHCALERLPPELTTRLGPVTVTSPALTALDLVAWIGGRGIHEVLRLRLATLDDLSEALRLTSGRWGNALRRAALHDSRFEPWSEAEAMLHRIMLAAGIRGWSGNVEITSGGQVHPVDAVFRRRKLILEVDGYAYHRAENVAQFHRDRAKWTALTAAGWTLLHFTWDHLMNRPDWVVETIRRALTVSRNAAAS